MRSRPQLNVIHPEKLGTAKVSSRSAEDDSRERMLQASVSATRILRQDIWFPILLIPTAIMLLLRLISDSKTPVLFLILYRGIRCAGIFLHSEYLKNEGAGAFREGFL